MHRDIKPSNIIVTPHGQAIVVDFGVAQVRTASDLTRSGATPGSPAFMSSEQRRGQATDQRTDVFSLAASIWQMLTYHGVLAPAAGIRPWIVPRVEADDGCRHTGAVANVEADEVQEGRDQSVRRVEPRRIVPHAPGKR
ncbi:MAG TPA: protein kinase, partial [Planctomycetota bacterium]